MKAINMMLGSFMQMYNDDPLFIEKDKGL